jgi:hypothetical protein
VVGLDWVGLGGFGYIDREYGFWLIWYYEDGGGKGLSLIWKCFGWSIDGGWAC